ncbi:hypothetical protein LCGC14_2543600, partial [marine sediment metagenome]
IGHNYIWHTSPYGDSNFEYLPADYLPTDSLKELRKIWEKKEKDGWLEQYQLELWKVLDNLAKKMGWNEEND